MHFGSMYRKDRMSAALKSRLDDLFPGIFKKNYLKEKSKASLA
jgi:hypothetical protein